MENSIDAGANEITVRVVDAGKSFISVSDNGDGMDRDSLQLCMLSHATSKLGEENLLNIHTFGFRGEALPSIASVSRLTIISADNPSLDGWMIRVAGSGNPELFPAGRSQGTTVEVRDLFFATPARLKFLKSNAVELDNCHCVFNRFAMAFPGITFRFFDEGRDRFCYEKNSPKRIANVLGESFEKNTFEVKAQREGLEIHGFIGVPTFNKTTASCQHFFVNNRFVRDKNFIHALRAAYFGLVPSRRYSVAVLFLQLPCKDVDVNAHPAKIEVRFRENEKVRQFLLSELKKALLSFGSMRSAVGMEDIFSTRRNSSGNISESISKNDYNICQHSPFPSINPIPIAITPTTATPSPTSLPVFLAPPHSLLTIGEKDGFPEGCPPANEISLGKAIHQIGNTYIIAENGDSLVIVDQHAAAERITLEKLKNNLSLDSQVLLLPETCRLDAFQMEQLEENADLIKKFGIHYEKLTDSLISINALPAILERVHDAKSIIRDLIEELSTFGCANTIEEKIHRILSALSCHSSLRAGKKLTIQEMDFLLRQMERTQNIAQCCHGRPSYITLSTQSLNKIFERS
jgi:DNA mismatch repair protein MutL